MLGIFEMMLQQRILALGSPYLQQQGRSQLSCHCDLSGSNQSQRGWEVVLKGALGRSRRRQGIIWGRRVFDGGLPLLFAHWIRLFFSVCYFIICVDISPATRTFLCKRYFKAWFIFQNIFNHFAVLNTFVFGHRK